MSCFSQACFVTRSTLSSLVPTFYNHWPEPRVRCENPCWWINHARRLFCKLRVPNISPGRPKRYQNNKTLISSFMEIRCRSRDRVSSGAVEFYQSAQFRSPREGYRRGRCSCHMAKWKCKGYIVCPLPTLRHWLMWQCTEFYPGVKPSWYRRRSRVYRC